MNPASSIAVVESAEIRLDGVPDDPAWATAPVLGPFVTTSPAPGLAPTGETELRLLADDQRLYALFVAHDPEPRRLRAGLGRRDTREEDDAVALYVDPAGTAQRAYVFGCNALGAPFDGVRTAAAEEDDLSWDARWDAAARRTGGGFVVEMAIPWRAVRHPADVGRLGVIATRYVARASEGSAWPAIDPQAPSFVAQEAVLAGPGALPPSRGLDLVPELTWGVDQAGLADDRLGAYGFAPGLTVRFSPSGAVDGLGAVNPDFSQVESDAAQVSVNRRYPLSYEEKRPFFLEGQEWFDTPAGPLVYTRSMVTPLYGARSTVEAGRTTVALLHVWDRDPQPSVSEGGGGLTEARIGDAEAIETVGRARYALSSGSWVGMIGSDRELPAAGLGSRLGGVDTGVQLGERWAWTGALLASSTTAVDDGALAPAAETSLTYGTEHLQAFADGTLYSPGFRAENGFLVYADRMDVAGGLFLRAFPRAGPIRQWLFIPAQGDLAWRTDGTPRAYEWEPEIKVRLAEGWQAQASVFVEGEEFGGRQLDYQQPNAGLGGPIGRALSVWTRVYVGTGPLYDAAAPRVGHQDSGELEIEVQAGPRVAFGLAGEATRMLDAPTLLPGDADVLYAGFVGRLEAIAFATPRLWARFIVDRSTFDGETSSEVLVAWERRPASAVYVGGSATFADGTRLPSGWAALAKATWAFGW